MEERDKIIEEMRAALNSSYRTILVIICDTLLRHNDMTEEEYREALKATDSNYSEKELINIGIFNILVTKTQLLIKMRQALDDKIAVLKLIMERKEKEDE